MHRAVLLDTSFFIRFLNDKDPLFKNADGYFRHFIKNDIIMMISTITVAEYCVGGIDSELPLKNLQIIPFNFNHAKKAAEFAKIIFQKKNRLQINERNIIPNDTKLFSQADIESKVEYYLSSDTESIKIYNILKEHGKPNFQFIDLRTPHVEFFSLLDL